MFKLSVSTTFDAAHRLENYPGPCSRLHGHTYTATGEWEKSNLDRIGIALDMVELKKQLRAVVVDMDHCFLNRIRGLAKTTAEGIAQLLFERLSKRVPSGEFLVAVTVEETPGCSVRYESDKSPARVLHTSSGKVTPFQPAAEDGLPDVTKEGTDDLAPAYEEENTDINTAALPPGPHAAPEGTRQTE